jgi:hypothetical protein
LADQCTRGQISSGDVVPGGDGEASAVAAEGHVVDGGIEAEGVRDRAQGGD